MQTEGVVVLFFETGDALKKTGKVDNVASGYRSCWEKFKKNNEMR